jgi:hypothetical protein
MSGCQRYLKGILKEVQSPTIAFLGEMVRGYFAMILLALVSQLHILRR